MHNGNGNTRNGARDAVIIGALRTPFGKRGGQFSTWHPVEMLSFTLKGLIDRAGIDAAQVEDVIGGCVDQVGEQALNITRNAWLNAARVCRRSSSPPKASWLAATTWWSPAASRT